VLHPPEQSEQFVEVALLDGRRQRRLLPADRQQEHAQRIAGQVLAGKGEALAEPAIVGQFPLNSEIAVERAQQRDAHVVVRLAMHQPVQRPVVVAVDQQIHRLLVPEQLQQILPPRRRNDGAAGEFNQRVQLVRLLQPFDHGAGVVERTAQRCVTQRVRLLGHQPPQFVVQPAADQQRHDCMVPEQALQIRRAGLGRSFFAGQRDHPPDLTLGGHPLDRAQGN
jgi:hypothetical protein